MDSDGKCIVPAEVLARTGNVKVNLVGSIASGGVLTDRLTTYPILAVIVDANARVEGDEAKPVTPSQFEQFVAIVKGDADRAETAAGNANTSAGQAEGYADDAEGYMQRAETAAETAETEVGKIIHLTASAETLSPGSQATASYDYDSGTLTLGIPQGQTGATPNITIGSVTTLEPGSPATATITGTAENPVLNLGIPKGAKGDTGVGIESIYETGTSGAVHTYTILYTNGNTTEFTVTDGQVTNAALQAITGDLANLTTIDKANLVAAINELVGKIKDVTTSTKLKKLVTGNPIVLDDALGEVKSLSVELTPIQDLHGYSKPWAAGAGKNKFPVGEWFTQYDVGTNNLLVDNTSIFLSVGTYTLSFEYYVDGAPSTVSFWRTYSEQVAQVDTTKQLQYGGLSLNQSATTWTSNTVSVTLTQDGWFGLDNGQLRGGVHYRNIQVEQGSTATSYEPYSNICPITGHDSVTVTDTGVNQWDEEWEVGSYNDTTGEKIAGTRVINSNPIPIQPNTTYYLKLWSGATNDMRLLYYKANGDYISATAWTAQGTITTPPNAYYVNFFLAGGYGQTYNNDISINLPSTDHDYHAYQSHTYTVPFDHTVYGADVDVTGGSRKGKYGNCGLRCNKLHYCGRCVLCVSTRWTNQRLLWAERNRGIL